MWREYCALPVEAKNRTVDIRFLCPNTYVIREIPRRKIIGPVDYQIISAYQVNRVLARKSLFVQFDGHLWIQVQQPLSRRFQFRSADIAGPMENLTLQVGKID